MKDKRRKPIKRSGQFYVYIVQCKNGTYYIGYTSNLENCIKEHNDGRGAKYLKGQLPVRLVFAKEYRYFKNALLAEKRIKKLRKSQKEEMIKIYAGKIR